MIDLNNSSILITGGTGSFGVKFIQILLEKYPKIKRLVVLSRDEHKQWQMLQQLPETKFPFIQFSIGDVRDKDVLIKSFRGIDIVIHAAALKHVQASEINPLEFVKTNVLGADNVIEAAIINNVKHVVALSTDKAVAPLSAYGATKLCAEKLFVNAGKNIANKNTKFSIVRYGNMIASRGSVVPFFLEERKKGVIPVTNPDATRFFVRLDEEVQIVFKAIELAWGGEIFIPKIPSFKLKDLVEAVAPNCEIKITGLKQGEKLHEELISEYETGNTIEKENYYVVLPLQPLWDIGERIKSLGGTKFEGGRLTSQSNSKWVNREEIQNILENR